MPTYNTPFDDSKSLACNAKGFAASYSLHLFYKVHPTCIYGYCKDHTNCKISYKFSKGEDSLKIDVKGSHSEEKTLVSGYTIEQRSIMDSVCSQHTYKKGLIVLKSHGFSDDILPSEMAYKTRRSKFIKVEGGSLKAHLDEFMSTRMGVESCTSDTDIFFFPPSDHVICSFSFKKFLEYIPVDEEIHIVSDGTFDIADNILIGAGIIRTRIVNRKPVNQFIPIVYVLTPTETYEAFYTAFDIFKGLLTDAQRVDTVFLDRTRSGLKVHLWYF